MLSKLTVSNSIFYLFFVGITMALTIPSLSATAQEQSKPQLVEIVLNDETSDEALLKIAETLNPDLFYIEDGFGGTAEHYASYIPLDSKNRNRFFAVTVVNTSYFCTSYGCPTYIYESLSGNKWKQVLSVQSNGIYYDVNTPNSNPDNIVSTTIERGSKKINLWLWNGLNYKEAKRK